MDKYYTPEIEEFYVGFEYETNYLLKDWEKRTLTIQDADFFFSSYYSDAVKVEFRVKHLDQEDIESLGFELDLNHKDVRFNFLKFPYRFDFIPYRRTIENICRWGEEEDLLKRIKIKNKSELKKLLKQLNIPCE